MTQTEQIAELGESLEDYASNRAHFHELWDSARQQIAKQLIIAKNRVAATKEPGGLQSVKEQYVYLCGKYEIPYDEMNTIWWNYVYDNPAPAERQKFI
jgi:hypothetical protein